MTAPRSRFTLATLLYLLVGYGLAALTFTLTWYWRL